MNVKEKMARATNAGSLAWDEEGSERAVDRLAALGLAQMRVIGEGESAYAVTSESDRVASCLWRLKYGGDRSRSNYQQAFGGVCQRVHGRHNRRQPSDVLRAVVAVAIEEWRVETCPTCHGRKFVGGAFDLSRRAQETRARVCLNCNGMGILQRSDVDRADAVMNLLRAAEADRMQRSVRMIESATVTFIVSAAPALVALVAWGKGWSAKYQDALETILHLDASLGSRIGRKLSEERR